VIENLLRYVAERSPAQLTRDIIDILIVYYVFYRLLLVARGTRAIQIAAGLAIISLLYVVAQTFELVTIVTLVGALLQSIILVIVVVFQNDIRRALQRVGSRAFLGGAREQQTEVIEQVVEAARELARHRIGAIIAFQQEADLDEFVGQNKGVNIDAEVSAELLVSMFIPEGSNKLHDGAIVIRNLRIAKAGVFFPMPESRSIDSHFGSRHRAALGITEETDTVVVVVSEERGTISFCFNGNIAPDLQANQLREMLFSIMSPKAVVPKAASISQKRDRESADRVSIRAQEPPVLEEAPAPISTRTMPDVSLEEEEEAPKPLRKSALPESKAEPSFEDDTEENSVVMAAAEPRPMPKAGDSDRAPDSDESPENERRTPS